MKRIDNSENNYSEEHRYLLAKKRVEKIKGFYWHLASYIIVNIFISCVIVYGLMSEDGDSFNEAITNFGVYATWVFWGIGLFFHWVGAFGTNVFFGKDWEDRKIKEYMNNDRF
ncbi:2TM domain-containing protein [Tenacibaculum sp. S7007]|uniref:2TM domain-containing protein n=1 Tax=Tenacibaculum pelagium TaxID=2759527 RepID=A0A839ANE8_9FLAO|nr:2TM domain-containing protein [Tenacibaculum pelagium]MBA6156615.1 2TM domain-containing protein [Tenacibaculum pelagium]